MSEKESVCYITQSLEIFFPVQAAAHTFGANGGTCYVSLLSSRLFGKQVHALLCVVVMANSSIQGRTSRGG